MFSSEESMMNWRKEMKVATERINKMRVSLKDNLENIGAKSNVGNWDHVT